MNDELRRRVTKAVAAPPNLTRAAVVDAVMPMIREMAEAESMLRRIRDWANSTEHGAAAAEVLKILDETSSSQRCGRALATGQPCPEHDAKPQISSNDSVIDRVRRIEDWVRRRAEAYKQRQNTIYGLSPEFTVERTNRIEDLNFIAEVLRTTLLTATENPETTRLKEENQQLRRERYVAVTTLKAVKMEIDFNDTDDADLKTVVEHIKEHVTAGFEALKRTVSNTEMTPNDASDDNETAGSTHSDDDPRYGDDT